MILTDLDILKGMEAGHILITGFDRERLGPNSYDLTLSEHLATYMDPVLDARKDNPLHRFTIPGEGYILSPGELYLGSTRESTTTRKHVPLLEGKSSTGRLGIDVHKTAGFGDIGFEGYWTLEITVTKPVKVYAGMPIAQVYFLLPAGQCLEPYSLKKGSKYHRQGPKPMGSQMFKNFQS